MYYAVNKLASSIVQKIIPKLSSIRWGHGKLILCFTDAADQEAVNGSVPKLLTL